MNLREWRKSKELSQEAMGRKLGLGDQWKTYQGYESGRTAPPQSIKDKIRRLGYEGSWPQDETNDQAAEIVLTAENFIELRGAVKALREDLKQAERVQFALIGAIRQLAKAANLPHLGETLE